MSDEVLDEVRRIFAQELGRSEAVLPEHELVGDLRVDSVAVLTLVVGLENRFRVILPEEAAEGVRTVADLVRLVHARRGAA